MLVLHVSMENKTKEKSSYFFIGKLSDSTSRFNVLEEILPMDFRFEVYFDSIYIWGTTDIAFDRLLPMVKEMYKTLVAVFVFKTNKSISVTLNHWLEAQGVVARRNMIGWFAPPTSSLGKVSPRRSRINTPWRKAALFVRNQKRIKPDHRLAIKDYSTAVTDSSLDAFLFAYRAIEDICRAINGGVDEIKDQHWNNFHRHLGTNKRFIDPLRNVAEKVRHGNNTHPAVLRAEKNKGQLINISHEILELEFKRILKSF